MGLMNPVAMFSDIHMLPGLHVTLLSMLRALSPEKAPSVKIILYLDSVPEREQELLVKTHHICSKGSQFEIVDYSPKSPSGGDLLHGNATTYGRIYLADLLPNDPCCVYLDCDLLVNRCIMDIFEQFDNGNILLVDGTGKRSLSRDKPLYERAGLDMNGPCFNTGVMGINLELWRECETSRHVAATAVKYMGMLLGADQALLNVALASSFKMLGDEYNTKLYPGDSTCINLERKIYHFVGSPKPWDFLGRITSNHYTMWEECYRDVAIARKWPVSYSSPKRIFNVSKQTLKRIKQKIFRSSG